MRRAMRLSLSVGLLMLAGKVVAFWMTRSTAILSDAAESVIHVVAVAFAAFSLWLSARPADRRFQYGYERVSFFSAGFEGALIALASIGICLAAIEKWRSGLELSNLGSGTLIVLGAALINLWLGLHLVRTGRRERSIILEANGRHVLADSWTSFGVIGGLVLVLLTGWKVLDPLCAIAVGLHILWSGSRLMRRAVSGLMDYADPATGRELHDKLESLCAELGVQYHGVRYRNAGYRTLVEIHLLFPYEVSVGEAHRLATALERRLPEETRLPIEVVTHLEALEDHDDVHDRLHRPVD